MCQPGRGQRGFAASQCDCSCGCGSFRRFISAKEQQEWLEEYRDQLRKELAGVEERIQEFKSK
jgi:hypothetical protein